jgi:Short C-terminal domain
MPLMRRRPLMRAAMVGGAGYAVGKRHEASAEAQATPAPVAAAPAQPPAAEPVTPAASEANRIDALTKLKSLFDSGVLTEEQYESERARLTAGI